MTRSFERIIYFSRDAPITSWLHKVWRHAVLGPMLSLLVGCNTSPGTTTTIRFWNGLAGPDGRTMLQIVKKFNKENPDLRVVMQRIDWNTYYNKLFVSGLGGRAPEVFIIHLSTVPRFLQAGFIRPVDDLANGPDGIDESDFVESVWERLEEGGKHYAVPLDLPTIGLYFNKKLFREAGIVDESGHAKPPADRKEFLAALSKLTRDLDGDGRIEQWGFAFSWYRTNFITLLRQWGGAFFTPENDRCVLNDPANVEALEFCVDLIREKKLIPPPQDFETYVGFRQGKVGMFFEGPWMLAWLDDQDDLECGAAPVPILGRQAAAWSSSHTLCIRTDLDENALKGSWRFVKYLSDNGLDWAAGGQIPARYSQLESDRFARMEAQSAFAKQLSYVAFEPRVTFYLEFETEFTAAIDRVLRGTMPAQESLDLATDVINEIIARQRRISAESAD